MPRSDRSPSGRTSTVVLPAITVIASVATDTPASSSSRLILQSAPRAKSTSLMQATIASRGSRRAVSTSRGEGWGVRRVSDHRIGPSCS